jgi:hypothetical protein
MSFPEPEPEADSSLLAAYLVSFISPDQVGAESSLRRISRDPRPLGQLPPGAEPGGPDGGSARQLAPRAPRGEPGSPLIAHILSVGGAGTALSTLAPFV